MSKDDLTMLLALALAAQKGGLVNRASMPKVNEVCNRVAQLHKMMSESDILVIGKEKPKAILIGVDSLPTA